MQTARKLAHTQGQAQLLFPATPGPPRSRLRARIDTGKRTNDTLPGVQAFRRLALCPYALSGVKLRLDRGHHPFGYLVLKRKDRGELAIITFGPHMMPGDGINELRGDTHPVRRLANTTFKRVAHSQLATYLLHVDHPALVGETRIACDHE